MKRKKKLKGSQWQVSNALRRVSLLALKHLDGETSPEVHKCIVELFDVCRMQKCYVDYAYTEPGWNGVHRDVYREIKKDEDEDFRRHLSGNRITDYYDSDKPSDPFLFLSNEDCANICAIREHWKLTLETGELQPLEIIDVKISGVSYPFTGLIG